MTAKKNGCLGKILGVVFTSIVVPVLVNVFTLDMTDWQRQLGLAPEAGTPTAPATPANWNRPVIEDAGEAPAAATRCRPEDPGATTITRGRFFGINAERKGRESNPQGVAAEPFSRRSPAPMGWPFQ